MYRFEEETFQEERVPVWEAAHPDDPVVVPIEVGECAPGHTVGLGTACQVGDGQHAAQDDLLLWEFDREWTTSGRGYAEYEG